MSDVAYVVLENGKVFEGRLFGASVPTGGIMGELAFTTGMTNYLETLTDKNFYGQIIVQTFPLIGNYGVIAEDMETERNIYAKGYIVKDWCREPSNFRCEGVLDTFLKEQNITGLYGVDTRALTRLLRQHGNINGIITDSPGAVDISALTRHRVTDALPVVSTPAVYDVSPTTGNALSNRKVAVLDCGVKACVIKALTRRGCFVRVFPYHTTASEIVSFAPDGVLITDGSDSAFDREAHTALIALLQNLQAQSLPLFGMGLGHQLLARANGYAVKKLKQGHRGGNQPVKETTTGRVYITGQNHGYAVDYPSADGPAQEWFYNVNDRTNEGLLYKNAPVLSTQFCPDDSDSLLDTAFLYDRFIKMMSSPLSS